MFDRQTPFNALPPLPPASVVETPEVLRKTITASRALAELKGMAERMPNQAMLIDSLVLQEARASSGQPRRELRRMWISRRHSRRNRGSP